MLWRGRRQSSNIEDARGQGGGGLGGGFGDGRMRIPIGRGSRASGGSIGGILLLVIVWVVLWAVGIDPTQLFNGGSGGGTQGGGTVSEANPPANDQMTQFVGVVLAETEEAWNGIFQSDGKTYQEPTLTLFGGRVQSACGDASSASGPFYCPTDRKVYLDTEFFDQLDKQFGASGDFAQAYVIAHEVGHHVQNLTGVLPRFHEERQQMSEAEANAESIKVELQADCYAGVWAYHTRQKGLLEQGDLEEALNAAQQIGDDTLQKRTQGYVVPDSFNHGTSAQRTKWFKRGFDSGKPAACDTFNNPV